MSSFHDRAPGRIFICYRRDAAAFPAALIYGRLCDEFGDESVFKDIDSIKPGENFVRRMMQEVQASEMLLAVITDNWAGVVDEHNQVRLSDPADYVRVELEAALSKGLRVIPVLVGSARMPRVHELPESLAPLVELQAHEIDATHPNRDVDRLVEYITEIQRELADGQLSKTLIEPAAGGGAPAPSKPVGSPEPTSTSRRPRRPVIAVAALVLATVLTFAILNTAHSPGATLDPVPSSTTTPTPKRPVAIALPQAEKPLADDVMIWRRAAGGPRESEIVALGKSGQVVKTLVGVASGNVGTVLSPDRRTFLYAHRGAHDTTELHARATDGTGGDVILFSGTPGVCPFIRRPAWRADGLLAVPCGLEHLTTGPSSLKTMTLDGKVISTLAKGLLGNPTFVDHGTRVVFWRAEKANTISGGALYSVPADGTSTPRSLTDGRDGTDADPAASPRGDVVAYRHREHGSMQIRLLDLDTEESEPLSDGRTDQDPSFSPDGSKVSFKRGAKSDVEPWMINISTKTNHAIVHNSGADSAPSWTGR